MKNKAKEQYDALNEFLNLPSFEEWVWTEWVVRKPYIVQWIEGLPF